MSSTVLYMSMSLDGFIAGPNETVDNGLGDGGMRLHEWLFPVVGDVNQEVHDEFMTVGAIVAGRGTFDQLIQHWNHRLASFKRETLLPEIFFVQKLLELFGFDKLLQ